jgi:hypothetical protein
MERDSIISHGTSLFLQESMMERSDKYRWPICKNCGIQAIYNGNKKNRIIKCRNCGKDNLAIVQTPYSFKLLTHELQTMGIDMRLNTEKIILPPKMDIEDYATIGEDDEMIGGSIYNLANIPQGIEDEDAEGSEDSEGSEDAEGSKTGQDSDTGKGSEDSEDSDTGEGSEGSGGSEDSQDAEDDETSEDSQDAEDSIGVDAIEDVNTLTDNNIETKIVTIDE